MILSHVVNKNRYRYTRHCRKSIERAQRRIRNGISVCRVCRGCQSIERRWSESHEARASSAYHDGSKQSMGNTAINEAHDTMVTEAVLLLTSCSSLRESRHIKADYHSPEQCEGFRCKQKRWKLEMLPPERARKPSPEPSLRLAGAAARGSLRHGFHSPPLFLFRESPNPSFSDVLELANIST